ncbi:MAG: hypothetical protein CMJ18_19500 [Phycisphaeraceae bacterium]|nr:hypothetical protein [Phycisphaeraceae bacterium]
MNADPPIRVGLIRCDTHGAYFAPLMAEHDPVVFDQPVPMSEPERVMDSWMAGGNHFYFYQGYASPTTMTADFVGGFEIARVHDERNRARAEVLAEMFFGKPKVCDTFAEVSDDVDLVLIADCNFDGSDHLELATPGITKGVPTFIDKPLANDLADVRAILELARRHDTPIHSMSILGAVPDADHFRSRLAEIGPVQAGSIQGGGTAMAGHIHSVVLALNVFGRGVRRVWSMGEHPLDVMRLDWGDADDRPPAGVTITSDVGSVQHCAFFVEAYGPGGAAQSRPIGDFRFPFGAARIIRSMKEMVRTRKSPESLAMMVEGVAIVEAARAAHNAGRPVEVEQVEIDVP